MFEDNYFFEETKNSIIKISGSDKFKFLQGIISNDIFLLKNNSSIYSAILSPQGKFISDFIISKYDDNLLVEINNKNLEEILKKFSLFKLKSDVSIQTIQNVKIVLSNIRLSDLIKNNSIFFKDPRFQNLFVRNYIFDNNIQFDLRDLELQKLSSKQFETIRLRNGVPDFQVDKIFNKSFLMEMRFDKLNGISWDKGCYLGQEITARMYYRKKIPKKIYQIKINFNTQVDDKIFLDGLEVGIITSHDNKNGLAYLKKLDDDEKLKVFHSGDSTLEVFDPWWSQ